MIFDIEWVLYLFSKWDSQRVYYSYSNWTWLWNYTTCTTKYAYTEQLLYWRIWTNSGQVQDKLYFLNRRSLCSDCTMKVYNTVMQSFNTNQNIDLKHFIHSAVRKKKIKPFQIDLNIVVFLFVHVIESQAGFLRHDFI